MGQLIVKTSSGTELCLEVEGIDQDVQYYAPISISTESPSNYSAGTEARNTAGSNVGTPFQRPMLNANIRLLPESNYVVEAVADEDITMHVGRYEGNSPKPHWNIIVKRVIRINDFDQAEKIYTLKPIKDAHIPMCDWVELLLYTKMFVMPRKRHYWSALIKLKYEPI